MRLFCRDIIDKTENEWTVENIFNHTGRIFYSEDDDLFLFKENGNKIYHYDTNDLSDSNDKSYEFPYYFVSVTNNDLPSFNYKVTNGLICGYRRVVNSSTGKMMTQFATDMRNDSYVTIPTELTYNGYNISLTISDVAYGNGYFVFLGYSLLYNNKGTPYSNSYHYFCYFSTDLTTFNLVEISSSANSWFGYERIDYIDNKFIAYDASKRTMSSTNINGYGGANIATFTNPNNITYTVTPVNISRITYIADSQKYIVDALGKMLNGNNFKALYQISDFSNRDEYDNYLCLIDTNYDISGIVKVNNEIIVYGGYNNHPFILESKSNGTSWKKPIVDSSSGAWNNCAYSKDRDLDVIMLSSNNNSMIAWKEI